MAIVAGLVGSFIGGLLISLMSGDGLDLRPSGIIGSLAGAIVVSVIWRWWEGRNKPTAADRAAKRSGIRAKPTRADGHSVGVAEVGRVWVWAAAAAPESARVPSATR